jgi:C4-dicarboxylate transporter, DctM subunit
MLIGTPIAVALGSAAVVGIVVGLDMVGAGHDRHQHLCAIAKYPLIAIPLFILTGMMFERSGVAARLVDLRAGLHRAAQRAGWRWSRCSSA